MTLRPALALLLALALSAAADARTRRPPALPAAAETFHFLGTEPFWGGELRGGTMVFNWTENEKGVKIKVQRRAIRNRLVVSGVLPARPHFMPARRFTMTVIRRSCSDGMSDRTYPFDVTIASRASRVTGCGWTARRPYREEPQG